MSGTRVTGHESRLEVFDPNALAFPEALSSSFNATQEPGVMFELIVEPIILRPKSNQYAGGPAMPRDYDLFGLRQS
jgi:hypothetical protein